LTATLEPVWLTALEIIFFVKHVFNYGKEEKRKRRDIVFLLLIKTRFLLSIFTEDPSLLMHSYTS